MTDDEPVRVNREQEDLEALQAWEAEQSTPPTLFDVLATRDIILIGAYVLRAFRSAAAIAVEQRERVARVRRLVVEAFGGDANRAEAFLRHPSMDLGGAQPLELALQSDGGAEKVIAAATRLHRDESES
jgi:hypothetical protein